MRFFVLGLYLLLVVRMHISQEQRTFLEPSQVHVGSCYSGKAT